MKKKNINVLYIITKLELGGAQKVCLSLIKGLQDSGDNPILISGKQGVLVPKVAEFNNVILIDDFKREVSFSYLIYEIRNFINLVNRIKKLKIQYPDLIVHTHSTKAGVIGRWAAFFAGVKNRLHTIHGYGFNNHQNIIVWSFIYFVELFTSLITTHFICVSSQDIKTGKKLFPKFEKKHSLIRAAIDWNQFYGARKLKSFSDEDKFVFGTVACFKKQKNLIDLLKAFEVVCQNNNNCVLEIVGDGKLRPEIENWISQKKLENKIILHGWQDKVSKFMINWNAFALSSLWEGLPCAIVEARLLKLPILAYNTGGISDIIIEGKNGFLYKQYDWNNLALGMIELSKNKNLYHALENYEEDLTDFMESKMVSQHKDLYYQLKK